MERGHELSLGIKGELRGAGIDGLQFLLSESMVACGDKERGFGGVSGHLSRRVLACIGGEGQGGQKERFRIADCGLRINSFFARFIPQLRTPNSALSSRRTHISSTVILFRVSVPVLSVQM